MNKSSVSCTQRFTYSQILQDEREPLNQILHGKTDRLGSNVHQNTELWTELMVSQWNSSGTSSQDSPHCSFATKVQELLSRWSGTPEKFTERIIFMSMFNDISWGSKDKQQEIMRVKCSTRLSLCKEIRSRTMVIPRTWIGEKVVLYW